MNGIIVADKPADWTSHDVVAKLRGILLERRIGHGGTLDPMATGVLPVFIGRATRAVQFCENAEKEYLAGLRLGLTTDTQDITGNVLSSSGHMISGCELSDILPLFLGAQKQIPPMYSAVKIGGKKLYELARRGIETERPARDIFISSITLLGGADNEYTIRVVCSKGTYIRTLCNDIGHKLGCGGVMSSLRRLRAGSFTIEQAYSLQEISDAFSAGNMGDIVRPVDSLFSDYPAVTVCGADVKRCKNGASCEVSGLDGGLYRVYAENGEFLMLGEIRVNTLFTIKSFFEAAAE